MIPREIFTSSTNSKELSVYMTFGFPKWLQELLQVPFSFLRSFSFTRKRSDPLSTQVLHHQSISMIVSRFTSFTNNFVLCFYQVTKCFCTRYDFTSTSCARKPSKIWPLADLAISVFRKVCEITLIARYQPSLWLSRGFMRRARVWISMFGNSFIHKFFSEFLQPFCSHSDISEQYGVLRILWSKVDGFLRPLTSVLSSSDDAGVDVELVCGVDVGDVEPDELDEEENVDNLGTTVGT